MVFKEFKWKRSLQIGLKCEEGGRDECLMDCEYEYVFVNPPNHHGFLPHRASQRIDPLVEKGIKTQSRISHCGI
jgi:hypothetical protein